jgi:transposase
MARDILTDEKWERLSPLLPPQKPKTGRPAKDHRTVLEAILWIDRTGAPWRDLPPEYGPWRSVATRFYRWVRAGVWERVLADLQRQADAEGEIDWRLHHVDGSVIRAHQHAAGAKKGGSLARSGRRRSPQKIRKPLEYAGEDSPPRSTCALKAKANP